MTPDQVPQQLLELSDPILVLDQFGRLVRWNDAALALLGIDSFTASTKRLWDFLVSEMPVEQQLPALIERLRRSTKDPMYRLRLLQLGGAELDMQLSLAAMGSEPDSAWMAVLRATSVDAAPVVLAAPSIESYVASTLVATAERDPNRRTFAVVAVHAAPLGALDVGIEPIAGVMLDRLRATSRVGDLVTRVDITEFALVVHDAFDPRTARRVADRLISALTKPINVGRSQVELLVTAGVVISDTIGATPDDLPARLLERARIARGLADARGVSGWEMYDRWMHAAPVHLDEVRAGLGRALQQHEIEVVYQPITALDTGAVTGVEVLVRWDSPRLGIVQPTQLIAAARELNQLTQLTRQVLDTSLRQLARWRNHVPALDLHVNVEPAQLSDPALLPMLSAALLRHGVPPESLVLDIGEDVTSSDPQARNPLLQQLSHIGVRLALDGFGTAYAALPTFGSVPFSYLKMDRSFTERLGTEPRAQALVDGILSMTRRLGMTAVAEGVETTEQRQLLRALGCEYGQGYLFARPLTGDELTDVFVIDALRACLV